MTKADGNTNSRDPVVDLLLSSISKSRKSNVFLGCQNISKLSKLLTSTAGDQVSNFTPLSMIQLC